MNPVLAGIGPSLIRELNSRKQPGDIDLGLGEPRLPPDGAILAEAAAWAAAGCRYGPNAGDAELRGIVARHFAYDGLDRAENVCLTVGSQEAIFLALKTVCAPGRDEVLVVEPAYPLYRKIAQLEGVASRGVDLPGDTGFGFQADRVLAALSERTRLIVLCSPGNPTGRIAPRSELAELARGLLPRTDPPFVLVDEAYRELYLGDAPVPQLADLYPRTLVAGSLSKSNALTGLRLGWLLAPADVLAAATRVHQLVLTSASTLSQRAARLLFEGDRLGAHRAHYQARWTVYRAALEAQGLEYVTPEGGFYTMVRLPGPLAADGVQAAFDLQAQGGVVAIPGEAFGESARGWLRTSFVASAADLAEGAARMARFFARSVAAGRPG